MWWIVHVAVLALSLSVVLLAPWLASTALTQTSHYHSLTSQVYQGICSTYQLTSARFNCQFTWLTTWQIRLDHWPFSHLMGACIAIGIIGQAFRPFPPFTQDAIVHGCGQIASHWLWHWRSPFDGMNLHHAATYLVEHNHRKIYERKLKINKLNIKALAKMLPTATQSLPFLLLFALVSLASAAT